METEINLKACGVPDHWRNVAKKATRVRVGDLIGVAVEGGWVSRPAPCDGFVYETLDGDSIFVPAPRREPGKLIPLPAANGAVASEVGSEGDAEPQG